MNFDKIDEWIEELGASSKWLQLAFLDDLSHCRTMTMREEELVRNWERHNILFADFKQEVVNGFGRVNAGDAVLQRLVHTLHSKIFYLQPLFRYACDEGARFWNLTSDTLRLRLELNHSFGYRYSLFELINERRKERLTQERHMLKGTDIDPENNYLIRFSDQYLQDLRECGTFEPVFEFLIAEYQATNHFLQSYFDSYGLNLTAIGENQEPVPTEPEPDKGLSAFQKLLFIRLLQEQGFFPKKPNNTDDAPELKAIALLTGLSFKNQIKGGTGAAAKVNQLLNDRERISLTPRQAKHKLDDLNAIEYVAGLLNLESIFTRINQLRKDLNRISGD